MIKASSSEDNQEFDIILANIIKIIILDNLKAFIKQLKPGGVILISGLLKRDEEEVLRAATQNVFSIDKKIEIGEWMCLKMTCKSAII